MYFDVFCNEGTNFRIKMQQKTDVGQLLKAGQNISNRLRRRRGARSTRMLSWLARLTVVRARKREGDPESVEPLRISEE